jgi:hypothetical protein
VTKLSTTRPEPAAVAGQAFVIMPFDSAFDDLYTGAIRPTLQASGYSVCRLDEAATREPVLARICQAIETAQLVVAVVTGKNPHVFFELGLTFGRGKPVILLARSEDDIPCFLEDLPRVIYRGDVRAASKGLAASAGMLEVS